MHIENQENFLRFMQIAAARTRQLINYANFARDIGISEPTVKTWINILRACGLIYILQPYHNNHSKRLIKTPKLYFLDTGLCSYLTGWPNANTLELSSMSGAMLETYVISEIIKNHLNNGKEPRLYFYRKEKNEIDLLLEANSKIYPLEIKKTATPGNINIKHLQMINKLKIPLGAAGVLCLREDFIPLSKGINAIPIGYI